MELCTENNIFLINGTTLESISPGCYTSFQSLGSSVIDYAITSKSLVDHVKSLQIDTKTGLNWSDHAALCLTLSASILPTNTNAYASLSYPNTLQSQKPPTALDNLLDLTLKKSETPEEAITRHYGPVYLNHNLVDVYTDGSCISFIGNIKKAGAGVFWSSKNKNNAALRVPGLPTNNRAELYASTVGADSL